MSRGRSILLVVEGEKAEPALMRRALEVYGITDVDEVYSYGANVYDLYRRMFEGADDAEDLSLTLVLRERENDPDKRALLDREYSDIVLVFDFDPQDHLFSAEKLERMIGFFDESTENGKLYLNYPMVEAYRDLAAKPYDETYRTRSVSMEELASKTYKEAVGARSAIPQLDECSVLVFNQMLLQNIEKASGLVGCKFVVTDPLGQYDALSQDSILSAETKLLEEDDVVSVLCTCLWFVIDYGPRRIAGYLRAVSA